MTWRLVYASEVGTSHLQSNLPCQDSCWAKVDELANHEPLLSIFISDGAGSAIKGGEGAELAIAAAAEYIAKKVEEDDFRLSDDLAKEIVTTIRQRIDHAACAAGLKPRDFACTFLGLLSKVDGTLVLQIGDGAIIVDCGSGLQLAVVPMSGEYANMTHFVTDEDAASVLVTKFYPGRALRVAALTDGMQRLTLDLATNTPYEPFFAPFFKSMAKATVEQEDMLQSLLVKFLGSESVNGRTDDDKTLAFATWML